MKTISLNTVLFHKCIRFAGVITRKGALQNYIHELFKASVFVHSEKGSLRYFATDGYRALEITEPVDKKFNFEPTPIAIDAYKLDSAQFAKLKHKEERFDLEIPDCTFSNLLAFHNPDRPKWLKNKDLQTTRVCVAGQPANLVYIKAPKAENIFQGMKTNRPFTDFCWNKYADTIANIAPDNIYGFGQDQFDSDFELVKPTLENQQYYPWERNYYYHTDPLLPDSITLLRDEKDVYDGIREVVILEAPIAKWERTDEKGCRMRMIIMGKTQIIRE